MTPQRHFRQRGLTLVELMLSLTLGALVMLAASALLVASSGSYLQQSEAVRLNDGGRYALDTIARAIRQAAFVNWDGQGAPAGAAAEDSANVSGLDARSVSKNSDGIDTPLAGAVNGSDVLAVRFVGAGTDPGGDGSVLNCAGFGVGAANSAQERGWSIFYVAIDADGEAELRCKYRGEKSWGADAIVRGVDSFQVLYGLDTDVPADGVANQYVNATAINALDDALLLVGADAGAKARDKAARTYWKRVVSIRIALLLHGEPASRADKVPMQFDLFGKDYSDVQGSADAGVRIDEALLPAAQRGRARKLLETTIALRNRPD